MNPIDIAALVVLAVSAAFGLARGFVREVLGLAAWVGAALGSIRLFAVIDPPVRGLIANRQVADAIAWGAGFVLLLIVLSIVADLASRAVRATVLGGLDRLLGLAFGAVRGAALLVAAYVLAGLVVPPGDWPQAFRRAFATPLAYQGAAWAVTLVPQDARPRVDPPGGGDGNRSGAQPVSYVPDRHGT